MYNTRKLLSISTLALLFSLVATPSLSAQKKETKKGAQEVKVLCPSASVQLVPAATKLDITLKNGTEFSLPQYEKVLVANPTPMLTDTRIAVVEKNLLTRLQENTLNQKEMTDLSLKLGIDITDSSYLNLYRAAASWLGTRYKRGGMSSASVDCSGFTNIIYKTVFDTKLARVSTQIAKNVLESVSKDKLLPGDLVFFSTLGKKHINHVGVYLGEGSFVHASIKKGVIVSTLAEGYYSKAWRKGGRME